MDSPGNLTANSEAVARSAAQQFYGAVSLLSPSSKAAILLAGVAMLIAVVSYTGFAGSKPSISSRKAQQAKAMREAYKSMEKHGSLSNVKKNKVKPSPSA
jgi:hypothetical protein